MVITFRQRKLQRVVNDTRKLEATYGARMAKLIQRRLLVLEAADNLSQIPPRGPLRLHQLFGDRAGQFSVDLVHPYRLVFVPNHEPVPTTHDGGIDRTRVTDITVIGILDTHQ
ncbi:MAG: type II toxin-antitoxin system RelE/ParE family toxin [Caldilineaceae bacterium]|nr:type II toxin-antitoxin system RelE/ParE family toxin [Caldilineaceae bacterium]